MTHDEFYSRLLENRRIIQPPRFGLRRERRAWVARASMADEPMEQGQGDLWRRTGDTLPLHAESTESTEAHSVDGRVVGRIAGGQIIPMEEDDA